MATKLFVRSLAYAVTDDQLRDMFAACGTVVSAKVVMDRDTNRSKGFGFVEMSSEEEAKAAIEQLDGKDLEGRQIFVAEARPQAPRENRSFGGGDRGGFGGGDRNQGRRY
jgi:RNA recognition motif-containing protein